MQPVSENVLITSSGIKNSLKKYKPLQALAEYVWNGFDANATQIDIEISETELKGTQFISVRDNGTGIDRSLLAAKFKPFFESEKIYDPNQKHSATHGKNGVGRLTFFTFANIANWQTVYCHNGQNYSYGIGINAATLSNYWPGNETAVDAPTGTTVCFSDLNSNEITPDTVRSYLAQEFCWFLELNKKNGYVIYINGELLTYSNYIIKSESIDYTHENSGTSFSVRYICWNIKLSEYSKYYYINSNGTEMYKENTTLNNKGDRFYHSVYIESALFDHFDFRDIGMKQQTMGGLAHRKTPEFEYIIRIVNAHLYDIRRPFIKENASKIIDSLEIEGAFPSYNPKNILDQHRKTHLSEMISALYIAEPKLFTGSLNKEQKKTFVRLLDLIMVSGEIDSLFHILDEILDMTEAERADLSDILKYTHLSHITKTIKLIRDRYQAVFDLKQLVFNPDLHANEVDHLQKMIEQHYWLFGEQYNLVTAAEPNFEEALRRYLRYLHEEYEDVSVEHPDKLKQMDIFAVRQDITNNKYHNIVVELKHPNIAIGETQLSQVKKYMRTIMNIPDFNASNMSWEFYLVGTKFSSNGFIEGELNTNKNHGEPHLVYKSDQYKIYVLTWSELFASFEMRHSYLEQKLNLEREKLQKNYGSAKEVIANQQANTAIMPPEMSPTK